MAVWPCQRCAFREGWWGSGGCGHEKSGAADGYMISMHETEGEQAPHNSSRHPCHLYPLPATPSYHHPFYPASIQPLDNSGGSPPETQLTSILLVAMNDFGERRSDFGEAFTSARQPNFLQKLYDFLSLDPHPCPNVIYWASDSRQLVIAQPEKLMLEVLPKLFKHNKLSSFGRQLNIYGFSRLFPGRHFKNSKGNIFEASLWAHPTLHRLSTPAEVGAIKRRAAPKLFRTRRLANGNLVRTRAGPAVEARAREIKESIAESRRLRGRCNGIYANTHDDEEPQITPISGRFNSPPVDAGQLPNPFLDTWQQESPRLAEITEGVVAHKSTPMSEAKQEEPGNCSFGTNTREVLYETNGAGGDRELQSCPARLHLTPVPARFALSHVNWGMFLNTNSSQSTGGMSIDKPQTQAQTLMQDNSLCQSPLTTAYPLSPGDTCWPDNLTVIQTPLMTNDSLTSPLTQHIGEWQRRLSWESDQSSPDQGQGTIDPRWVSPLLSVWRTPAVTPIIESTVHPHEVPLPLVVSPDMFESNMGALTQAAQLLGTQSYPPRITERRLWESQPAPLFLEQPVFSIPIHTTQVEVMPPPSLPGHIIDGVFTSMAIKGKRFH